MATTFPRVNFLGAIAGILALVSILLPWWGITTTGFGSSTSSMWGFFWWSQPQPRHQQRFRLLQYDHNLQPNHSRPSAPLHCPSDCGKLHTARQNPRRQLCDLCRRPSRLRGAHRLHCIQQLSRNGLHHSANRLRNNIWSNPHLGLPTRILHLHSSNNPSARRNGIPSNPDPASLQRSDLQSESMILCQL